MRNKKIFYSILIFVISIGLFSSCSHRKNQSSEKYRKSIIVQGNSVINIKSDTAILKLSINTIGKNNIDIQLKNKKIINNIVDNIVKLGVCKKDINISNYNSYQSNNNKSKNLSLISDCEIGTNISIKIRDINKIGEIINKINNEITKFSANITDINIQFTVNDYDKYYKEALKKAIENGNNKAKALSKSLGVDLGNAVKIYENQNHISDIYSFDNKNSNFTNICYEEKFNNAIEANKLITASVDMTFEYY